MHVFRRVFSVSCIAVAALIGCSNNPASNQDVSSDGGNISIRFVADAQSNFSEVATTAEVRVSAEGMISIIQPLSLSNGVISGTVGGIPAGSNRKFEVFVYDQNSKVCYYGNATGSVTSGGTANISMVLNPVTGEGSAAINGTIAGGTNTPPTVSLTSPVNNAQYAVGASIVLSATAGDADGTISSVKFYNGSTLLNTDATAPYTYTITSAAAGSYSLTALATDNLNAETRSTVVNVSVVSSNTVIYQINAGGSAVAPYAADAYFSGGTTASTTSAITTTGVVNPAPQAVYQKERYGAMTYTLPNLTAGASYTVRLHFAELYWTASAKRRFNVSINGTSVLSNYDIFVAAGAAKKAIVREFTATANASRQIIIAFTNVTDNAQICAIEIVAQQTADVTPPVVTLSGSASVTVNQNGTWTDPGATAVDNVDGAIVPVTTGTVNLAVAGVYTLTYTATDVARNTASVQRTVTVVAVAAWTQLDRRTRSIDPVSMFVLGANEVPHVVEEINDGSGNRSLTLKKLNTSGVLTVVNSISGQAFNGVSLALGSDNTTLFMGTVSSLYSTTSIGNWNIVDNVVWNSVGGYGLQIGPGNTPYIAAMDYNTFAMRIWKRVGGTWGVVGSDINIPLNNGGGVSDKIFCVTPSGGVYTIGVDYSDPGVSVASLNGSLWNIEKIYSTEGSNHQIVAAGSNLYASFRNGTDYVIYQKASGSWSTTAMSNTGVAATSFSMAASPTGTLYGARLEGTNVVVKKLVGAAWQSVGSATAFTTTSGSNIQILPGTTKCYAVVKTSNEWIIYSITN